MKSASAESPLALLPSTLVRPLEGVTPTSREAHGSLERLTAIEIKDYYAYRGTFHLYLPKGENLLVYGENGSGKSSLFHAIRMFLEAPDVQVNDVSLSGPSRARHVAITDNRHRFNNESPVVRLEFGSQIFEWSESKNDTKLDAVRLLNQGKGFLDYKALLEVHHLQAGDNTDEKDLFQLLVRHLLPYYTYPRRGASVTFKKGWECLKSDVKARWRRDTTEEIFLGDLKAFNEALKMTIEDLGSRTNSLLQVFGDEFAVSFKYVPGEFKTGPKRIDGPKILVVPAFRKLQLPDYHRFFNEARLSGLAICLFFAALKESPATGLRILMLDDILIGLDMINRVKVVELIRANFKDWQVIILTFSKAWFERLKSYVKDPGWSHEWQSVVLWEDWRAEDKSPYIVIEGSGELLGMAERHLKKKDYKAAAVYARSALEALCHHTCARANMPVIHVEHAKDRKLEDYIVVLEERLAHLVDPTRHQNAVKLIVRLREAQAFVLNKNSHFDVQEEDALSGEVGAAIQTVKDLSVLFTGMLWRKSEFKDGIVLSLSERLTLEIAEARKLAKFGSKHEAIIKMSAAHRLAWEVYGVIKKVVLPIGDQLLAKTIWDAALDQKKLEADCDERLKTARPYLFGNVKDSEFDNLQFEAAVKLLEELASAR